MAPPGIPGIANAAIDVRVFAVAILLGLLTGASIGVWPAISVFRVGDGQGLRATGTASPGARTRGRFALVTTQIALTVALLGGSALLLRSLWNVASVPLGIDAERVVTLTAYLSRSRYTSEQGAAFFQELLARARSCQSKPILSHDDHRKLMAFLRGEDFLERRVAAKEAGNGVGVKNHCHSLGSTCSKAAAIASSARVTSRAEARP